MDLETRLALIKGVGEEIVTEEELRTLLETKERPVAYDGFEPSGIAHLPIGVFRPLLIKDLIKAKVHFKLLIADSFAWINNKLGGDLEQIRNCGRYFIEVWKAAGVDMDKVEVVWHKQHFDNPEYWKKVILIAKEHTLARTLRALTIAGRIGSESNPAAFTFYPSMQCADIFQLQCDICQLGLDQRKVNMLAREIGPKIGYWKPVVIGHHMLLSLQGPGEAEGYDELAAYDRAISSKMSKSKPETSIFVHDSREQIFRKIHAAYCPEKVVEDNPILDYSKHIIFRAFKSLLIERPAKYGGNLELYSYNELERVYRSGELHPLDLKLAVANYLDKLIAPIREHFEKDKKARELYEFVSELEITR
jgi:tyrosyl-tRNA synthetase